MAVIFTFCHRCGIVMENGRCPACFELDERACKMFLDLAGLRVEDGASEPDPPALVRVADGGNKQK